MALPCTYIHSNTIAFVSRRFSTIMPINKHKDNLYVNFVLQIFLKIFVNTNYCIVQLVQSISYVV